MDEPKPTRIKENFDLNEFEKINNELKNKNRRGYEQSMELLKSLQGNTVIDTVKKPIRKHVSSKPIFMDRSEFDKRFSIAFPSDENLKIVTDIGFTLFSDEETGNYAIDMSQYDDEEPLNITNPYGKLIIINSNNENNEYFDLVDTGIEDDGELFVDSEKFELLSEINEKLTNA